MVVMEHPRVSGVSQGRVFHRCTPCKGVQRQSALWLFAQVLRLELLDAGQGGLAAQPEGHQRQRQVLLVSTCMRLPPRPSWVLTARLLQLCGRGADGASPGGEGSSSSDSAAVVEDARTSGYVSEAAAQGGAEARGQGAHGEAKAPGAMLLLLLGLACNSVELWSVDPVGSADRAAAGAPWAEAAGDGAALVVSARCCSQLQLFSMALLPLPLPCGGMRVWVAAGGPSPRTYSFTERNQPAAWCR